MVMEMREPTFFVLAALAGGRLHGYGIIKDTAELSAGRVSLKVGTLYAALERLTGNGWVVESGEEVVDGRLRRYYELTDTGLDELRSETERQRLNAQRVSDRLAARNPRVGLAQ